MKRTAVITIITVGLAAAPIWFSASLTRYGEIPVATSRLEPLLTRSQLANPCKDAIIHWHQHDVRRRIVGDDPAAGIFAAAARRALVDYAANGCPHGALLAAGEVARQEVRERQSLVDRASTVGVGQ